MTSNISIVCPNWAASLGLKVLTMRILFSRLIQRIRQSPRSGRVAGRFGSSKLAASFETRRNFEKFFCPAIPRSGLQTLVSRFWHTTPSARANPFSRKAPPADHSPPFNLYLNRNLNLNPNLLNSAGNELNGCVVKSSTRLYNACCHCRAHRSATCPLSAEGARWSLAAPLAPH